MRLAAVLRFSCLFCFCNFDFAVPERAAVEEEGEEDDDDEEEEEEAKVRRKRLCKDKVEYDDAGRETKGEEEGVVLATNGEA